MTRTQMRSVSVAVAILAAVAIVIATVALVTVRVAPAATAIPPIRAAFVYEWYPETWTAGSNYNPALGRYDSSNPTVLASHIEAMKWGGIEAGIASWWGQGTKTDSRFPALLSAAKGKGFSWTAYYEPEGQGDPSSTQIGNDLAYFEAHYTGDPAWLRVGGKPVLFVYGSGADGCGEANRWAAAAHRADFYVVLKVFAGYRTCAAQPDSWHQYGPAVREDHQGAYSFTISPGFWKSGESAPRLARDPAAWNTNVCDMLASGAQWQLVTTFNEWGEGTAVEPATEWQSGSGYGTYLDTLRSPQCATPSPSPTATATPSATPSASPTSSRSPTPTASPSSTAGSASILMAAGDIACDPATVPTSNSCEQQLSANLLGPATVVQTLGDNQYEDGALTKFGQSYGPSWGAYKAKTHPAIGNHEALTTGATGYCSYFGAAAHCNASGTQTGAGFYSYNVGGWHVIALNGNCSAAGGCDVGSAQYNWLVSDLAANPVACTIAAWHQPRFSSGQHGNNTSYQPLWQALYNGNADIVLNGHDHDYERFAPQTPSGAADTARGIREFVVGTGGKNHYAVGTPIANSQISNGSTFGVLKLTLGAGSYSWQFLPIAGSTFSDAGTGTCH